ncbi:MAG: ABC transporter permease [Lachnospiraceae bacterium]|nr:ABC transporter permease [Lachnospiraceae bacterium]MCM1231871.1 ABC transporter permease [Ruminococcus flavefaciens]
MRAIRDIRKYWNYMLYSARSRLKAEVANSYLNWIWWVLEPFCFMLIYTVIFGYIFESSEQYFPVYIFIGNTLWGFFSRTLASSVTLIRSNESIIAKVYLPKYILLIVEMMVNGFKMLVSFGLTAVMMVIFRIPVTWNLIWVIPIMIGLMLVTFGFSSLLMHGGVYIVDLSHVITIFLNIMMYFTGIFFSIETRVPEPFSTLLGVGNPVAFLLTSTRKAVIYSSTPDLQLLAVWTLIGLLLSAVGIRLIYKKENSYVKIM